MRADVALFLALFAGAASAQQLGTLFHTPGEREELDRQRRGEPARQPMTERPAPAITGYVKRSDGKSTVFLDKQPYPIRSVPLQGRLEPGVVDRYEPEPSTPPAPVTARGEGSLKSTETPATQGGRKQAASPRDGKDD